MFLSIFKSYIINTLKKLFTVVGICLLIIACSKDNTVQEFELTLVESEGGSLNILSGTYQFNSSVTLTAIPKDGYDFTSWTGSVSSSESTITIIIDGNKNITANFSEKKIVLAANGETIMCPDANFGEIAEGTFVSMDTSITNEHEKPFFKCNYFQSGYRELGHF